MIGFSVQDILDIWQRVFVSLSFITNKYFALSHNCGYTEGETGDRRQGENIDFREPLLMLRMPSTDGQFP